MEQNMTEITRSFSYKLNVGNYESRDFFCSQKAECEEKDAEKVAKALHDFCKEQVMRDVNQYIKEKKELDEFNDPNYYQNHQVKNHNQNRYNPKNQDYIASDGDHEDLGGNSIK